MSEIALETAWRLNDPRHIADAKAFWARVGKLAPHLHEQRAGELGVMVYAGEQVVGIATAELVMLPGLRARFAVCQGMVDPGFRRKGVAMQALGHLRALLEAWSVENPDEQVMGMAGVIEAHEWVEKQREPVWREWDVDLTLIGYTPRGQQIRVTWFRHARV